MLIRTSQLEQAQVQHPGAYAYIRVKGGYLVFDWPSEYAAWKAKKSNQEIQTRTEARMAAGAMFARRHIARAYPEAASDVSGAYRDRNSFVQIMD